MSEKSLKYFLLPHTAYTLSTLTTHRRRNGTNTWPGMCSCPPNKSGYFIGIVPAHHLYPEPYHRIHTKNTMRPRVLSTEGLSAWRRQKQPAYTPLHPHARFGWMAHGKHSSCPPRCWYMHGQYTLIQVVHTGTSRHRHTHRHAHVHRQVWT